MDRLTKQDNDALREQEWRLIFEEVANIQNDDVPEEFAQDTFMVKTQFAESSANKEYLILLTNLKQLWVEKLDMEQIRRRSKVNRSHAVNNPFSSCTALESVAVGLTRSFGSLL